MNIKILREEKNEIELELNNVTIAEILRVYLNEQGIEFAAWKREHPSKPVTFLIKSSGKTIAKAVAEAIAQINKDCDSLLKGIKK
ncbi:MAG: RpoL/Rpb11 RNA polymerase subunit family protein [Nanoarchaeota archaeon]